MPRKLESVGAASLMQETFPPQLWFVNGLLGPGCYILASTPKLGKSLLCLSLGLAVSSGSPFLETFATKKCGVCILALEDRFRRVQARLWTITDEASDDLRIVEQAEGLEGGLVEQLAADLADHPGTGLYVVDTFAAVRARGADYQYQGDYDDLRAFADFADENGVCVLVCHHCKKSRSEASPFLDISGTTGLTGAVAGMIVLRRDEQDPGMTVMSVEGKDVPRADYKLALSGCSWRLVGEISREEMASRAVPECVMDAIDFINAGRVPWRGSAAELMAAAGVEGLRPDVFGKHLAQHRGYMTSCGVSYVRKHLRTGNVLELAPIEPQT